MPGYSSPPPAGYVRCRKCGIDVAAELPSAKYGLCPDCKPSPRSGIGVNPVVAGARLSALLPSGVRELRDVQLNSITLSETGFGRIEVVERAAPRPAQITSPLLKKVSG